MRLHKNNCGITLIELVISMAIAAIILSMIAIMINTAAKSFKHTNEDVNLQMEAQITLNQLSSYIMEATNVLEAEDTSVTAPDVKYKLKYLSEGVTTYYVLYFIKDKGRLYLVPDDPAINPDDVDDSFVLIGENQYLMAEYVDSISIDYSDGKTAKVLIHFKLGDQEYTAEKNIKLRNVKKSI